MQTLAVKHRPKTFDDVVEQGSIRTILEEQLRIGDHKNCYLFCGGAGTGKTTTARIFAREINKHQGNAIEIDAASNNGVDNVRTIIDDAKFKSIDSAFKVYIIDECHMLSTGAWNAMLKLIEEPPAQTIFIFCTTDPQKIPSTILSRVQRYDFKRITFDSVVGRLEHILQLENEEATEAGCDGWLTWEKDAIEFIAKLADGGMRDAITLLDKCISFNPEITMETVTEALGTANYDDMVELTVDIINGEEDNVVKMIEEVHRKGIDLKQFMKQYSLFLLDAYKYMLLEGFEFLQLPNTLEPVFEEWTVETFEAVKEILNEVIQLNSKVKWETTPKPMIEATLIFLAARFVEESK